MPAMCYVDGCNIKQDTGRSFFRCPKDKVRCDKWKQALGFAGTHKYANLTPEQCYARIKICDLHFPKEKIMRNNLKSLLQHNAVPLLNLRINNGGKGYKDASVQTEKGDIVNYYHVSVQTEDGVKTYKEVSLQTYIFTRDKSTQTLKALSGSANTSRNEKLKGEDTNNTSKRAAMPSILPPNERRCQKELETAVIIGDIEDDTSTQNWQSDPNAQTTNQHPNIKCEFEAERAEEESYYRGSRAADDDEAVGLTAEPNIDYSLEQKPIEISASAIPKQGPSAAAIRSPGHHGDEGVEVECKKIRLVFEKEEDRDEDLLFFKSLLPDFKLLPRTSKMALKVKVQKLLYEETLATAAHTS